MLRKGESCAIWLLEYGRETDKDIQEVIPIQFHLSQTLLIMCSSSIRPILYVCYQIRLVDSVLRVQIDGVNMKTIL